MGNAQSVEGRVRVGEGDLGEDPLPGQRGAQLVGCVRDEPALRLEGRLQPGEQSIEGVAEFLQFVVWAVQGEPLVQVGGGDVPRRSGDGAELAEYPSRR